MALAGIRAPRDELYRKVWERPVSVVAKEYGISDVGLAKMCRRLNVPVPRRGYWAKKQHGEAVEPVPLPPAPADVTPEVTITATRRSAPDPEQLEKAAEITDAEYLDVNQVQVSETLSDPLPSVARSLKLLSRAKPGANGLLHVSDPACLPVTVSRRRVGALGPGVNRQGPARAPRPAAPDPQTLAGRVDGPRG